MVVERVLNNNSFMTVDKYGCEVIVMGRGIGFRKRKGDTVSISHISECFRAQTESIVPEKIKK